MGLVFRGDRELGRRLDAVVFLHVEAQDDARLFGWEGRRLKGGGKDGGRGGCACHDCGDLTTRLTDWAVGMALRKRNVAVPDSAPVGRNLAPVGLGNASDDSRADPARQPNRQPLPDTDQALVAWIFRPGIAGAGRFAAGTVILPNGRRRRRPPPLLEAVGVAVDGGTAEIE